MQRKCLANKTNNQFSCADQPKLTSVHMVSFSQ